MSGVEELFIEFDGRQLTVTTDIPEVRDYIGLTFAHMIVPRITGAMCELAVLRTATGCAIESAGRMEYADMHGERLLQLVRNEVRLQFMRSRPDLLWLHAGAVAQNGRAILLSGASGQGKSSLTTRLCELGWGYLSDEIAPLRMDADTVIPFPQAAVRRVHPGREVTENEVRLLARESVIVSSQIVISTETPVEAIVFINYASGLEQSLTRLSPGFAALELLRNLTNFINHKAAAVARAAELVQGVPVYLLSYQSVVMAGSALDDEFRAGV